MLSPNSVADENQKPIEAVFAELGDREPEGFTHKVVRSPAAGVACFDEQLAVRTECGTAGFVARQRSARTHHRKIRAQRIHQCAVGRGQLGLELADPGSQGGYLVLELQDATYTFDPDARSRELRNRPEQLDVPQRVASAATPRTAGAHQTEPVIAAQCLWMHPGQLGSDADDEDRLVDIARLESHPAARHAASPGW